MSGRKNETTNIDETGADDGNFRPLQSSHGKRVRRASDWRDLGELAPEAPKEHCATMGGVLGVTSRSKGGLLREPQPQGLLSSYRDEKSVAQTQQQPERQLYEDLEKDVSHGFTLHKAERKEYGPLGHHLEGQNSKTIQ